MDNEERRTRERILDSAWTLFLTDGYEKTPVQVIIDAVGIAKGTFYHHFRSKEEMMVALVDLITEAVFQAGEAIVRDPSRNARDKLIRFFREAAIIKIGKQSLNGELLRHIKSGKNEKLDLYVTQAISRMHVSLFAPLVREGVEQGVFRTKYPEQTAEILVAVSVGLRDRMVDLVLAALEGDRSAVDELLKLFSAVEDASERLLGLGPGELPLYDRDLILKAIEGGGE